MSEENFRESDTTPGKFMDLNISSYFWYMGYDWSPSTKQEIIQDIDETEESKSTNRKPLILTVIAIMALLITAVWMRASRTPTLQQANQNSVQQIISAQK